MFVVEMLAASFSAWLFIMYIADFGCTLYAIPWHILNAAHWLKDRRITVLAYPLYAIGWTLHVLVRVIWYGAFIVLGAGFIWFLVHIALAVIKSFL